MRVNLAMQLHYFLNDEEVRVWLLPFYQTIFSCFLFFTGYLHKAKVWLDEESLRAERIVRLRDCPHHIQQLEQTLSVCQHRHGQSLA